jgi:hypothetical protein
MDRTILNESGRHTSFSREVDVTTMVGEGTVIRCVHGQAG